MTFWIVESGNGRVMAIKRAITDAPESYARYKTALLSQLAQFGLSEADAKGLKYPVLVRERLTKVERRVFAQEANTATAMSSSAVETARTDAKLLSLENILSLEVAEGQGMEDALRSPGNRAFVRVFLGKLPDTEGARMVDAAGVLNQDGVRRLALAVFVRSFPGDVGLRLAQRFFESTDPTVRNVLNGIARSLGKLAQAEALAAAGDRDKGLALADDLAQAVEVFANIKATPGMTVEKYLAQQQLETRQLNPFQERLLSEISARARSGKAIGEMLATYAQVVIDSPPPQQGGMFPGAAITKVGAWETALKRSAPEAVVAEPVIYPESVSHPIILREKATGPTLAGIIPPEFRKLKVESKIMHSRAFDPMEAPQITMPEAAQKFFRLMRDAPQEWLMMLLLDTKNRVIGIEPMALGTKDAALMPFDEIFRTAILASAKAILLAHNHPSGDPSPSHEDKAVFARLTEKCNVSDIEVLDMIVVGKTKDYSIKGAKYLPVPDYIKLGEPTKQPWEMTRTEYESFVEEEGRKSIEAWNKAGSKGFPPKNPAKLWITEVPALAQRAGYKLPEQAEAVLKLSQHRLMVEAAYREGKPIPPEVLKDYPDLAAKAAPGQAQPMIQDWQRTQAEYIDYRAREYALRFHYTGQSLEDFIKTVKRHNRASFIRMHHANVAAALERGDLVPARVLKDYPDLMVRGQVSGQHAAQIGPKTFAFSDEVLREMLIQKDKTLATKKEHGFLFCGAGGAEHMGLRCKGAACSVRVHDCAGLPQAGKFHTHPTNKSYLSTTGSTELGIVPSGGDMMVSYQGEVDCVGNPFTDKVNCWTRKEPKQAYRCPGRHSWSYLPTDMKDDAQKSLARQVCAGVREAFDFATINPKEMLLGTTRPTEGQKKTEEKPQEVKPPMTKLLPEYQIRLLEPLSKYIDKCNLSPEDEKRVWAFRPLRDFILWATGIADVAVCQAGMVPGAIQVTVSKIRGPAASRVNLDAEVAVRAKSVPNMKEIFIFGEAQRVYTVVLPSGEVSSSELLGGKQLVVDRPYVEAVPQGRLFEPKRKLAEEDKHKIRIARQLLIWLSSRGGGVEGSTVPRDAGSFSDMLLDKLVNALPMTAHEVLSVCALVGRVHYIWDRNNIGLSVKEVLLKEREEAQRNGANLILVQVNDALDFLGCYCSETRGRMAPSQGQLLEPSSHCRVVHRHDDGDLTLKCKGGLYVKTTDGKMFRQVANQGLREPGISLSPCEKAHSLGAKLERCILKVKAKGGAVNPIAVCRASVSRPVCKGVKT